MVVVALLIFVDTLWIALSDFRFDVISAIKVVLISAVLACVGWFYRAKRPNPRFEILCVETAFLLSFSAAATVFSYLITSLNLPLVDHYLLAADHALGFDWLSYVEFVNQRPWLGELSSIIYATTLTQVALTVIFLGLVAPLMKASQFVAAVMISSIICVAISGILPAAGALATLQPPAELLQSNLPIVDLAYKQVFFDLRSGDLRFVTLDDLRGLIAFPSYHGTLSMLVVLAFVGRRKWFWPIAALNFAVLASTPIDGGHHLIDVLGGVILALVAWRLSARLLRVSSATTDPLIAQLQPGE